MMRLTFFTTLICAAAVVVTTTDLDAAPVTFSTSQSQFDPGVDNQGWYGNTSGNSTLNDSYFVGDDRNIDHRNFFTFDLSSLSASDLVTSARLDLTRFFSPTTNEAMETLAFYDVTTDAATLNNNDGPSPTIFADLGSGTSFGTFDVPGTGASSDVLSFLLNSSAIAAINAAKGGFFSIGGDLQSRDGDDALFAGSDDSGIQNLVLNVEQSSPEVPEPSSMALFGLGLLSAGGYYYRRRRISVEA